MKTNKLLTLALLITGASFASHTTLANENVIIIKGGTYELDDTRQIIIGENNFGGSTPVDTTFEEDTSTFGIEYDHVFDSGFSIGGGYQTFSMDLVTTSPVGSGDITADFVLFNGKYHFTDISFKPYVGVSAGFVVTDISASGASYILDGNTVGFAFGAMAGFRWQFSNVGLYAEYKNFLSANTEDSEDAEIDLAGSSITGGISIAW